MRFTRATEYALRAVRFLAARGDSDWHSIQEISEAEDVPLQFLAKVMQRLAQAGITASSCGKNGGYKLGRAASRIGLSEVVIAVEGPLNVASCVGRQARCRFLKVCRSHKIWEEMRTAMLAVLDRYTVEDIVIPSKARSCVVGLGSQGVIAGCSSEAPRSPGRRARVIRADRSP